MRKLVFAVAALGAAVLLGTLSVQTDAGSDSRPTRYVVLAKEGASPAAVRAAVRKAGGRVLRVNNKVGVATAVSARASFRSDLARAAVIKGVARNVPIGRTEPQLRPKVSPEQLTRERAAAKGTLRAGNQGPAGANVDAEPVDRRGHGAGDVRTV